VGEMVKDGKFRVDKFNDQNYQLWKMQMEDYLYKMDLFLPLGGIEKNFTTIKALGMIWLSLVVSMDFNILKGKTMK
jgi:hypothetical protein